MKKKINPQGEITEKKNHPAPMGNMTTKLTSLYRII